MTDKPTFKRPRSGRADRDALIEWELGDDEVDREEDDDGAEERESCGEPGYFERLQQLRSDEAKRKQRVG